MGSSASKAASGPSCSRQASGHTGAGASDCNQTRDILVRDLAAKLEDVQAVVNDVRELAETLTPVASPRTMQGAGEEAGSSAAHYVTNYATYAAARSSKSAEKP